MTDLRFDQRMSDAEGLMWRLEKDPYLSSTFGSVTVLDRTPDFEALKRRMEHAARQIPRLHQRVVPAPGNLAPPAWVDDPDFSIDRHLRRIACPKPGSLRQVLDLATLLVADPFDRDRPLWQFIIVEGMRGGKAALIQKMHHTITDGERGIELSLQYLDFERDAPELPSDDPEPSEPGESHKGGSGDPSDHVRDVIANGLRLPLGVVRQVGELLSDPTSIPEASAMATKTLRSIVHQLSDTEAARSPLWTQRSLNRHVAPVRVPFDDTKAAAKRLGGTLNTAFLTAAAHAAATYHERAGAPAESLRASMVISTRSADSGANAFSLVRLLVPTGAMPIADRFAAVEASVAAARESAGGAGLDTLAALTSPLPASLLTRLARQQSETVDFATSNVRGAPMPVYIAGAQMVEIYPIGPLGGVAFNLTLMSYAGSLDMGLNVDTAAVTDPELLATCLQAAFAELHHA